MLPLEPVVKPDINITKIVPIPQTQHLDENTIIKQVVPVEIETDDEVQQQFEFVVEDEDRPSDDVIFLQTYLMVFYIMVALLSVFEKKFGR